MKTKKQQNTNNRQQIRYEIWEPNNKAIEKKK